MTECPDGWIPADGRKWNKLSNIPTKFKENVPDLTTDRRFIRTALDEGDVGTLEEDATSAKNLEFHSSLK